MILPLVHDRDPYSMFRTEEFVERMMLDLGNNELFRDLVAKHFLDDGGNKIKFIMKGSENFKKIIDAKETMRVAEVNKNLKTKDREKLLADNMKLVEYLERMAYSKFSQKEDPLSTILPKSTLEDVAPVKEYLKPIKVQLDNGMTVWQYNAETNGLVHLRLKFDTSVISKPLRAYIPLCAK